MLNLPTDTFYSGLSGLQLDIPKYRYPPPYENVSRITYYSSFFNSIEINRSFYKIPQATTVTKWAAAVAENFKFTFKLWKQITHSKELNFKNEDVYAFFKSINSSGDKKGCLLIQLPPGLDTINMKQLNKLLSCITEIKTMHHWKIAVEFRNKSWYNKPVYDVLNLYKAAIVIHDKLNVATPLIQYTADFIYVRFHGPEGNYRGNYTEDFLYDYATYINEWQAAGKIVYVYFNNTMGGAFNNLKKLNSLLHEKLSMA